MIVAVLIAVTEIAGMENSAFFNEGGRFFVFIVAEHDHGTVHTNFTYSVFVGIFNGDGAVVKRLSHAVRQRVKSAVADNYRGTFGQPVADYNGKSERIEIRRNVSVQCRRSADYHAHPASERFMNGVIHHLFQLRSKLDKRLRNASDCENTLDSALARKLFKNTRMHFFKHERNGHKNCRLERGKLLAHSPERRAKAHRAAQIKNGKQNDGLICVVQRKHAER